jgi:thiol-disulfide isomerase/thioredoxin
MKNFIITSVILFFMIGNATAEVRPLKIGDKAPAVKYSKWIKGTPVKEYKDDQVYILEYWATWCGPCKAAMPHLSELSKKYVGKATFIGVNVWERTGTEPYESSLPSVEKFVNDKENKIEYNVIADNNAQDMVNNWLKPAGIIGIPCTFIISKGKIAWIGHPMSMEKPLQEILNNTFDIAAFQKSYEVSKKTEQDQITAITNVSTQTRIAINAKDYKKAIQVIDDNIKLAPVLKSSFAGRKLDIYLSYFSENEAMDFIAEATKDNNRFGATAAAAIIKKDGLSTKAYQYAIDQLKATGNATSSSMNMLALAQSKAGQFKEAVISQEKAVELAKIEVEDPKFKDVVVAETVINYEKKLDAYKSKMK